MKVLLICPPNSSEMLNPYNLEPLGLEILAASLNAHDVKIADLRYDSLNEFENLLRSFEPDIAGFTVNNTTQVNPAKKILPLIRQINPHIYSVVGGHHPTLKPEDFFCTNTDAIFIGWAEKSLPQYVNSLESKTRLEGISGIITLNNGHPTSTNMIPTELEPKDIPFPDRSLVKKYEKKYVDELGRRTILVNTSRGCPYRCTFCACWKAANGNYLVRSAKDIVGELQMLPDDNHRIFFSDDNTFFDVRRAEVLYSLIKDAGIKKKYSGYSRTDTVAKNPDLFRKWKEIGLDNLTIGFEASDNETLKKINKANLLEMNQRAASILLDLDIGFSAHFLVDPEFEKKDFQTLTAYVEKMKIAKPRFVILTPLPGTSLYEEKKSKINKGYDYFDFMHWVVPTKMKDEEFYKNFIRLYYKAFSISRHIKMSLKNSINKLKPPKRRSIPLQCLSILELVKLRTVGYPIIRKLYRQYFKNKERQFLKYPV